MANITPAPIRDDISKMPYTWQRWFTDLYDYLNGKNGPKGEKGDKGDAGKNGADSTVPGPAGAKGDKGDNGEDLTDNNIDGGAPDSVYLPSQIVNGGSI